ncbi:hypothetical protein Tco_0243269 [Tanacetum coccineum]
MGKMVVAAEIVRWWWWRGGVRWCEGDVDGGVVMECRICGGSCGGYDVGIVEVTSFLDSCFISSTVSEDKRVMLCLDFKICAKDKNFSNIWAYTTMMLPRVRNHHGGKLEDCLSYIKVSESAQDRDVGFGGKLIQKLPKKDLEEAFETLLQ